MNLKTRNKTFSTYSGTIKGLTHLEELPQRIAYLEAQNFSKSLVHIVDREGAAVEFFRSFGSTNWLIRTKDNHLVSDGITQRKIKAIAQDLTFTQSRDIKYKGQAAKQHIAETNIIITRAATPVHTTPSGKRKKLSSVQGEPVYARLIVSRVVDNKDKELTTWCLLSNMHNVTATTLALWYYWRWSIESYFKLMKSAGMQLESWQQTTGIAIARRILVASMACVFIWDLAKAQGPEAGEVRRILIRLSGRQMKKNVEFTNNALLAGMWVLLAMQDALNAFCAESMQELIDKLIKQTILASDITWK